MIYFDSKYLSQKLKINPAKWKRWAREFLPPDPLGGYQSGYARQFSCKEAFRVFLGGHLVAVLRFTIPEARQILTDLEDWIKKEGFYGMPAEKSQIPSESAHIYVYNRKNGKFAYAIRRIVARECGDNKLYSENYTLDVLGAASDIISHARVSHARIIMIGNLYDRFLESIGQQKKECAGLLV